MCSIPRWGYRSPAPHLGPQHQEHVGVGGGEETSKQSWREAIGSGEGLGHLGSRVHWGQG